jgi:hypothetical protein
VAALSGPVMSRMFARRALGALSGVMNAGREAAQVWDDTPLMQEMLAIQTLVHAHQRDTNNEGKRCWCG